MSENGGGRRDGAGVTGTTVDCAHERSQIVDSRFFGHSYSTPASRRIFCDVCRMQRWLDVEAALALSQADIGFIPAEAATEIARAARIENIDLEEVRDGIRHTEHSLVPLLRGLERVCRDGAGEYVHYGATTQDIGDTGEVLEMRAALDEAQAELARVVARLAELARSHRDTLMVGRTHARPALPTTFGFKVAGWVDELLRGAERLAAARSRVLVVQLAGGVGTMAGFDGRGPELIERFAARLSLGVPAIGWHSARDRVAEYVTAMAMLAGSLGRIAEEIRMLGRPEFGELEEGWHHGKVGSSTMPHKRNPENAEQVVVMARLAAANAGLALEGLINEHERDGRALRLEWVSVASVSHHTLAALAILSRVVEPLCVNAERMAAQAWASADGICSEGLMLALARHVGRQTAHALVYEVSQRAQSQGRSLRESLSESREVTSHLKPDELDAIFDPNRHLGSAGEMVDRVVARAEGWLARSP